MIEIIETTTLVLYKKQSDHILRSKQIGKGRVAILISDLAKLIDEVWQIRHFHRKAHDLCLQGRHFLTVEEGHPKFREIYTLLREGDIQNYKWTAEDEVAYLLEMKRKET